MSRPYGLEPLILRDYKSGALPTELNQESYLVYEGLYHLVKENGQ